ncbi:hypothetical protein RMCBS344292_18909 [Rhizopus microsporus]|nr:hypothetical protein RMCBS344292_18909 [Rhizopus microsporus]
MSIPTRNAIYTSPNIPPMAATPYAATPYTTPFIPTQQAVLIRVRILPSDGLNAYWRTTTTDDDTTAAANFSAEKRTM